MTFHVPEDCRLLKGKAPWGLESTEADGNNGAFLIRTRSGALRVIASDGGLWEHCSVSLGGRCPTWAEMCLVKDLFWDPEDAVMQLHPPASTYVNNHPFTLHLWRPVDRAIPMPPIVMV